MVKRIAATFLWFVSLSAASEYATLIAGVPPILGLAVAVGVSAFVGLDPLHLLWTVRDKSAVGTVPRRIRSSHVVSSQA